MSYKVVEVFKSVGETQASIKISKESCGAVLSCANVCFAGEGGSYF